MLAGASDCTITVIYDTINRMKNIFRIRTNVAVAVLRPVGADSFVVCNIDGLYLGTITMTGCNRWIPSDGGAGPYRSRTGAVEALQRAV